MPASIINPTPQSIRPENASVFDSPLMRMVRSGSHFIGLDDPNSAVTSMMGPMPMVSIYKNQLARDAGIAAFKASVGQFKNKALDKAADWLSVLKPTVAAHMNLIEHQGPSTAAAVTHLPWGKVTEPIDVSMTKLGLAHIGKNVDKAKDVLAHEGVHVAGGLGNSNYKELYELADQIVGRERNPQELSAMARGEASRLGLNKVPNPKNAIKGLLQIVADHPDNPKAQYLGRLLQKRLGNKGPSAPPKPPMGGLQSMTPLYTNPGYPIK